MIEHHNGEVVLYSGDGALCVVNGVTVTSQTTLSQGISKVVTAVHSILKKSMKVWHLKGYWISEFFAKSTDVKICPSFDIIFHHFHKIGQKGEFFAVEKFRVITVYSIYWNVFLVSLETCCSCRLYHIYFDIKCFWKFVGYICRSTNVITFVVFVDFLCILISRTQNSTLCFYIRVLQEDHCN